MKEIVNAAEAAGIIGRRASEVRFYLQKGIWTFGRVIPPKATGKQVNTYLINVRDMCKYFGIPLEECRERMGENG